MSNKSRLAWRCRRGMREMDILFEKFVQSDYDLLSPQKKQSFECFVDETDVDIFSWITGKSIPDNDDYRYFISRFQTIHS